jgi:MoxR-like ATPase
MARWLTAGAVSTGAAGEREPPGLVGRAAELEAITALLDGARRGVSGVLVVEGEPGVGKTRLIDDALQTADGFRTLRVEGVRSEHAFAFGGLGAHAHRWSSS